MPPRKRAEAPAAPVGVDSIRHGDKRTNLPTADSRDLVGADVTAPRVLDVQRNTALDPQLVWRGKDAQDEALRVPAPPIYIQEKIEPRALIADLRKQRVPEDEPATLFAEFDGLKDYETLEFYQHEANWSNRMILGDSLEVMASLAEREDLRGKVQCIYIDPPYGIKFQSNWQRRASKRDVKDKISDATREVEQIKAFRDTWEDGIHSFVPYLRDRIFAARELLSDSGSIFVQIGEDNVHLVRSLLDEVFGRENFVSLITYKTTSGAGSFAGGTKTLASISDYLIWYAKSIDRIKYRQLFRVKNAGGQGAGQYTWVQDVDGSRRRMSRDESIGPGQRQMRADQLTSQTTREGRTTIFPVQVNNRTFLPAKGGWKTNQDGMRKLLWADRLIPVGSTLSYVRFLDDFPAFSYTNMWEDTVTSGFSDPKSYVVQTNTKVIERCLLMTTDPGDLVLDPTCGSGTTAYVAEQWGRRWITIDTSRVALALARQRLMGAKLPYYLLADSPEGRAKEAQLSGEAPTTGPTHRNVRGNFVYERVPHVTLKSIANNPEIREGMTREQIDAAIARHAEVETLYDRPYEDPKKVRVAGRFTVESLSPHRTLSFDTAVEEAERRTTDPAPTEAQADSPGYERSILDNLLAAGVQNGRTAERLVLEDVEPYPGAVVQAVATRVAAEEGTPQRVAIAIGPEYGTVSSGFVKAAAREAVKGQGNDLLLVLGFSFDANALETVGEFKPSDPSDFASVVDEKKWGKLPILLVRMNADLAMGDELLKKTGAGNLFTVFGEPDIALETTPEGVVVEIRGVDVYDPTTGQVRSDQPDSIALWMVDTDYDGESFFVRHAYFCGDGDPYTRLRRALKDDIDEVAWASLNSTRSRPFPRPEQGRIAVKAINDYGDEVLTVLSL
ncbi:site-specific DNA-methyltransferase [Kineococcus gypseus]|uniref:site-specific DNA-methyltransferase n=1 Tax=Kineococcus gypseus TaxID=1637102 RepID=UPI003D7E21E5